MKIYYNNNLKQFSRDLRNNCTLSEKILWQRIKGRKIRGYQFSGQKPIGKYVADFYCSKLKLVIEIDGISHIGKEEYDKQRQNFLESLGLFVLRFADKEVKMNPDRIIDNLLSWIVTYELQTNTTP